METPLEYKRRRQLVLDLLREPAMEKTKGQLRAGECFCLEGIVCEAYRRDTGMGRWNGDNFVLGTSVLFGEMEHFRSMPNEVKEWLRAPRFEYLSWKTLVSLNDNTELTFPEIADILERNWTEFERRTYGSLC